MSKNETETGFIVYDGECPFCSRYVKLLRLRTAIGKIELVDARSDHPIVSDLKERGYDLNDGMALVQGSTISHGDECINQLALMSTTSDLFNRMNALIFRSKVLSKLLYPILRFGRNRVLELLGRSKIE